MVITITKRQAEQIGVECFAEWGFDKNTFRWADGKGLIHIKSLSPESLTRLEILLTKNENVYGVKTHLRDITTWRHALDSIDEGKIKVASVKAFEMLLTAFMLKVPGQRVYMPHTEGDGGYHAYHLDGICYHPPVHHKATRDYPAYTTPDYVDYDLHYETYEGKEKLEHVYHRERVRGLTVAEILAQHDVFPETPELRADYLKETERFQKMFVAIGRQYIANGDAWDLTPHDDDDDNRWWRRSRSLNIVELPANSRVVVDVVNEAKDGAVIASKNHTTSNTRPVKGFWKVAKKEMVYDEDDDNEPEEKEEVKVEPIEIPIHPYLVVFHLAKHMRLKLHASQLVRYKYDTKLIDKLVIDDTRKALVRLLIQYRDSKYEDIIGSKSGGAIVMLCGSPGTGKCLGAGTKVLRADGRVVAVETIKPFDQLMGPDGQPRTVLSTVTNRGELFRITPTKGESWVCNDVHMMTLVSSHGGNVVDIPLNEFLTFPAYKRLDHKLFHVPIDRFYVKAKPLTIDPYFLGVWFGDGSKHIDVRQEELRSVAVSKPDHEIYELCKVTAKQWGLHVRTQMRGTCPTYHLTAGNVGGADSNELLIALRALVGEHITIPRRYLVASRKDRLAFLAGFLDTDGELNNNGFLITQKREDWATAIWWLARSLGFGVTKSTRLGRCQRSDGTWFEGTYHVVSISGHTDQIPTRIPRKQAAPRKQIKDVTRTGFTAKSIGQGQYYGFTLDGDGRFLLGDFTVTHNTLTAEVFAESEKRALYSVQCAQLGVTPEELENELLKVLTRAARWNAVLLLDEADVYVHKRGKDIQQNAMVGVFLRVLEYSNAVMFMTTNRAKDIDDAVASRCTARLTYQNPTFDEQCKIWRVLVETAAATMSAESIAAVAKKHPELSGRDVKNLIKLAMLVTKDKPITEETIAFVKQFKPT